MGLTDATDGARSFDAMGPARPCGAPRGLVRSVRALAAAALLALAMPLILPLPAHAQTDTTPPTLKSATVNAVGKIITLEFDEAVS